MPQQKDIRVEVRVRNNLVLSRMEEVGIGSVAELCRKLDETADGQGKVTQSSIGNLINMVMPARRKNGEWNDFALRLSAFFRCMPEDLFSDPQQWNKLQKNKAHAEVAYSEIQQLTARNNEPVTPEIAMEATQLRKAITRALNSLTPREERVLRMSFGFDTGKEMTLAEIGEHFNVSGARVMQIQAKALRKLNHPARRNAILAAGAGSLKTIKTGWGERTEFDCFDDEVLKAL